MAARIIDVLTHGWLLWWIICNFVVCILFANVLICLIFSILICFRRIVFSFSIVLLLGISITGNSKINSSCMVFSAWKYLPSTQILHFPKKTILGLFISYIPSMSQNDFMLVVVAGITNTSFELVWEQLVSENCMEIPRHKFLPLLTRLTRHGRCLCKFSWRQKYQFSISGHFSEVVQWSSVLNQFVFVPIKLRKNPNLKKSHLIIFF